VHLYSECGGHASSGRAGGPRGDEPPRVQQVGAEEDVDGRQCLARGESVVR
jgi:hypothetical protein